MPPTDETGEVTLFNSECRRGVLPEVCVKCGAPTRRVKRMTFDWAPLGIYALWLLGPLGMLMTFGARRRRVAFLPVCGRHSSFGAILAVALMLCAMFSIFVGFLGIVSMADYHGPGSDYARAAIGVTALVVCVACVVVSVVIAKSDIHVGEITETRLVLKRVHLDFIDALEDDRDRDEEYYARRPARREPRDGRDLRGR